MKKQILIIGTFLSFSFGYSQNTFPTGVGTNIGIGTVTPSTRLQITSETAGTSGVRLTNLTSSTTTVSGNSKALSVDGAGNIILTPVVNSLATNVSIYNNDGTLSANRTVNMNAKNLTFNPSAANSQFYINGTNGNVGIGVTNPTSLLEVKGSLPNGTTYVSSSSQYNNSLIINAGNYSGTSTTMRSLKFWDLSQSSFVAQPQVHLAIEDRNDSNRLRFIGYAGGDTWFALSNRLQEQIFTVNEINDNVQFTLPKPNSYLGIGTSNFIDGTDIYRLAVKGAIRADRVKVYTTWADFVFEKNYDLPSLEDVEKHIQEKGHLKDIPSAIEVEKNGIELGEMNKKLLQKVEELTLYLIELNKEMKEVKEQLNKK